MRNFDPSLYFITDSTGFTEEEFLYRVGAALIGGATMLQLREKRKDDQRIYGACYQGACAHAEVQCAVID